MQFKGRTVLSFVLLGMLASAIVTLILVRTVSPVATGVGSPAPVRPTPKAAVSASGKDLAKIEAALKIVQEQYLTKVDQEKVIDGAIHGMLAALDDPYTVYMDKEEAKQFEESVSSSFQGIGAEVAMEANKVTVVSPIKGSPAEKVGIRAGDVIVSVNGESLDGLTLNQAVLKIRGTKGTEAKLVLMRTGTANPIEVTIVRDDISVETVHGQMLEDKLGRIDITQFSTNTAKRFLEELSILEADGMKGLVIDVRNDPGGMLDAVLEILNPLVPSGKPLVIVEDRDGKREPTLSKGSGKPYPIVVLANKGSASASEILAGSLQENIGAKVIGEATFGKGTVQMTFAKELGDGSNIKMTVFKWLTPKGNWIHKKGILPDIAVDQPPVFKVSPLTRKSTLKQGVTSDEVKQLQIMLTGIGEARLEADGVYTKETASAVKKFQQANGLPVTGEVDAATADQLEKAVLTAIRDPKNDLQLKAAIDELKKQLGR